MYAQQLIALGIDLRGKSAGQTKVRCPRCGENKSDTDLSVNITAGTFHCFKPRCGWNGTVAINNYQKDTVKQYKRPVWNNKTELSDQLIHWFKYRGISQETVLKMKITEGEHFMPQIQTNINTVQFNYFRENDLVNVKYRTHNKKFSLEGGAELIFYNLNALKDAKTVIITEGEIDALSYIETGIDHVISVPNGASKSGTVKLEYLDNCWEHFEHIEKIIIATDNDVPGITLRNELARRLGIERCSYVEFGDCKDANEYLAKHGAEALRNTIRDAIQFPIKGIITVNDVSDDLDSFYTNGFGECKKIGVAEFDEHLTFDEDGALSIITGIPSHGKSTFLNWLSVILNIKYGWKFGIFSPENYPLKFHISKYAETIIGKSFFGEYKMSAEDKDKAKEYINNNFFFIRPDDDNFSLDMILEKARILVLKFGIKAFIIDPYNRLEYQIEQGMSETHYISKLLDKITNFKQKYNVHIFLVAHPTKIKKIKNSALFEIPNLYDISGSSNFFNKADIGFTVYRNFETFKTEIYVQKVRFKHWGKPGRIDFTWDSTNDRYYIHKKNTDNWLLNNNFSDREEHNITLSQENDDQIEF